MKDEVVLVGGFAHETNTFASAKTGRSDFQTRDEHFGDDVPAKLAGTNTPVGGAIDAADDLGVELRHTVSTWAVPGGVVTEDAYEFYTEAILDGVRDALPDLDGVLLTLHGAMVPEGMADGEGPLIARVRELVGEDVPIVVTLDLHGNVTDEMVAEADALVAYESYPHVDMAETGRTATGLLARTMRGEVDPAMAVERPPLIAYGPLQNTREGPMAEIMERAREYETRDDVLKVNVLPGFHQADVPEMGFSVPVVADGDPGAAKSVARELAAYIWRRRDDLVGDDPEPPEAVAEAKALAADLEPGDGPVVMADLGDNPGGGGAADGTTVLRELLEQGVTNAGFAIMRDPEAVEACVEAGVGERVTVSIGGKTDDLHGDTIEDVDGYVQAITDGKFVNTGPMATGSENDLGRAVHFRCGRDDGVSVVLTENRLQPLDAEIWRHVGVQPERLDVLVVKSTNHYRADYEPMASHVVPVNSIGLVAEDPRNYEYRHIRRPQYPLDEMSDGDYGVDT